MQNGRRILIKVLIIGGLVLAGAVTALVILGLLSRTLGSATGSSGLSATSYGSAAPMFARSADYAMEAEEEYGPVAIDDYDSSAPDTAANVEQKVIKTGSLTLEVEEVSDTVQTITDMTTAAGGFVQSSETWKTSATQLRGEVTSRVPVDKFESVLEDAKALALEVRSETVTGQDVTEQYTDLSARLTNAQKQEEELRRLLERAENVEEVLKVQKQLNSAREDVEVLQGRLNYLENQTAYSTITFDLREEASVEVPTKAFRPGSTIKEASRALLALLQNIVTAGIWIVIVLGGLLLPLVLVIWLVVWALRKKIRTHKANKKQ